MKTLSLLLAAGIAAAAPSLRAEKPAPAAAAAEAAVKNVTPDEAEKVMKSKKDAVVLDVRTAEEFEGGHIAGAKNVDFHGDDFAKKIAEFDKSKPYVLHCAAGGRSTRALETMKKHGFREVYHLDGGFKAWQQAGKPVAR
jgi:phage shock protein E